MRKRKLNLSTWFITYIGKLYLFEEVFYRADKIPKLFLKTRILFGDGKKDQSKKIKYPEHT